MERIKQQATTLEQLTFLKSLSSDIELNMYRFQNARKFLYEYEETPKEMEEEEWHYCVGELRDCYASVRFIHRLALMVQAGILTTEALYIWAYEEITDDLLEKLEVLVRWAGTGLDLAAYYDSFYLARIYSSLINLLEQLNAIHTSGGADLEIEGYDLVYDNFKDRTNEFISDPSRYSIGSDNYIERYVYIIPDENNKETEDTKVEKRVLDIPIDEEICQRFETFCAKTKSRKQSHTDNKESQLENALVKYMDYVETDVY